MRLLQNFNIKKIYFSKKLTFVHTKSNSIQMMPESENLPGILIELKAEKNCTEEELKKLSEIALRQIIDKKYDTDMKAKGVETIYKYGVAFSGKKVVIQHDSTCRT